MDDASSKSGTNSAMEDPMPIRYLYTPGKRPPRTHAAEGAIVAAYAMASIGERLAQLSDGAARATLRPPPASFDPSEFEIELALKFPDYMLG
jgi:hypothetical protein